MARITYADIRDRFAEKIRIGDICTATVVDTLTSIDPEEEIEGCETLIQSKYCGDILGNTGLYETFSRRALGGWEYRGMCEKGSRVNKHPEKASKVFICSAYHSDPEFNTRMAKAVCAYVYEKGKFPIAPHLYFPQFIPDEGFGRDWGIEAGHQAMKICDEMLIVMVEKADLSEGMKNDIDYAVNQLALYPRLMTFTQEEADDFIKRHLREEV